MERLEHIERKAVDFVRGAGKYGAHLTYLGLEVAGMADWLEAQIPRVRRTLGAVATAVMSELSRREPPEKTEEPRRKPPWDEDRELAETGDEPRRS